MEILKIWQKDLLLRYAQRQVCLAVVDRILQSKNDKRCYPPPQKRRAGSVSQPSLKKIGSAKALPIFLAGAEGLEPTTPSFGDWCSTD